MDNFDRSPVEGENAQQPRTIYRGDSMRSRSASMMSDVEMAHDEVYSGPMSESIPSSVSSFVHRRSRRQSTVSFTYFQESHETPDWQDEEVIIGDDEDGVYMEDHDLDLEPQFSSHGDLRSTRSRSSVEAPLLWRRSSENGHIRPKKAEPYSQKFYIATEDLTAVITGFSTRPFGFAAYLALCILSGGLAYLLFHWHPRWRVKLIGRPETLHKCQWAAIENQWGQFTTHWVVSQPYGRSLSTVFSAPTKETDFQNFDEDDDPPLPYLRFLDYRYIRFCYQPVEGKFFPTGTWKDPSWTNVKTLRIGLDAEERDYREQAFGPNVIDIQEKTIPQILIDEAFHPFYIFQVASLILWSLDQYFYYAACIFLISAFSIASTTVETRSTIRRLREMSHFECDVRVLRSGFWRSIASNELVPGDVFEVSDPSLNEVPCDCVLLAGDSIVNESMLTGESVPVSKSPITNESLSYLDLSATSIQPGVAKHFLFCGTRIIRARRPQDLEDDEAAALAMVVRTGFSTTKGALVRSMLFPKPSGFKFYRDSFRYISVMGAIAGVGFIASFVNFVRLGIVWHTIVVRALDLITIVVPPALPATLTIGTSFALSRLKKQEIFCISPQRVNVGGKLDVVCFDKTGTLTEDGLDVLGVRLARHAELKFSELLSDPSSILPAPPYPKDPTLDYSPHAAILFTMATCHTLRIVDDELIGDPLDVKMFQFTGWQYEEGLHDATEVDEEADFTSPSIAKSPFNFMSSEEDDTAAPIELTVLRSFEFASQLRRSSVVVQQEKGSASAFVKGAPECIRQICIPESLPPDFDELLNYYTYGGYRVIACGAKRLPQASWSEVQALRRFEAESDLIFIGFIIFENKLKPSTAGVLAELHDAHIRNVMCTGDNILTAISVARECGLIQEHSQCFVPYFVEGNPFEPKSRICWESTDNLGFQLDENSLLPLEHSVDSDPANPYSSAPNYSVALTGDVFRWIVDYGSREVLYRMLVLGQVFARMSPDEKHELVEKLQSLDYCVGFCGDGANDCGALRAADVGISLSEAEASIAAPFTSRVFDISCVPKLIREGRAALVTSFCCFKYMSLYSAIQFTSVSFLYASASNLGDFQFLFIDLLLILPIAIFMGWIGPYPTLCRKRPTANLVSRKVLTPLLGQIVICILVQLAAYKTVQARDWYKPPKVKPNDTSIKNSENTALFLVSCYQYILSGIVLSVGRPFRQPMTSNVPFVVTIIVSLLFTSYMLFQPSKWLYHLMQLTRMSTPFKDWLVILALGGFAVSYVSERRLFPALARFIGYAHQRFRPSTRKQRRRYKVLLEELRR